MTQIDQKQQQIVDIDGCSEASYSELKESVKAIETKIDRLIGLFYDQANQHRKEFDDMNTKFDKLFDYITTSNSKQ